jgi:hypothetical protein
MNDETSSPGTFAQQVSKKKNETMAKLALAKTTFQTMGKECIHYRHNGKWSYGVYSLYTHSHSNIQTKQSNTHRHQNKTKRKRERESVCV